MNFKFSCCLLLLSILSTRAEDVKLKIIVDDGETQRDLKDNIANLLKINQDMRISVEKLEVLRSSIESENTLKDCGEPVPSEVQPEENVFTPNRQPEKDALDNYMVTNTECKYRGLGARGNFDGDASGEKFDGVNTFKAVFAVRGLESVLVNIWWSSFNHEDYLISISDYGYVAKVLEPHGLRTVLRKHAIGALAPNKYEKYYITVDTEYLTFGRECDREPILRQKIAIRKGDHIGLRFRSDSFYGAKFLYDCPLTPAVTQNMLWKLLTTEGRQVSDNDVIITNSVN